MIHKEVHDNQLLVFWNGVLIYKRWLWRGYGVILDKWMPWLPSRIGKKKGV